MVDSQVFYSQAELLSIYQKTKARSTFYLVVSLIVFFAMVMFGLIYFEIITILEFPKESYDLYILIGLGVFLGIFSGLSWIYNRTANYFLDGKAKSGFQGWFVLIIGLIVIPIIVGFVKSKVCRIKG